ncbi:cytochrome P450 [Thalassomonas sp. RHCl1]|uniref:cytochrome P450 n=1 Tax=Thalassomonas sp. RHCl1 TaxID=2995320 RepID=UPI00248BDCBF|nr:cytochrome P450 [Thalassomonas sp. RHCl1]
MDNEEAIERWDTNPFEVLDQAFANGGQAVWNVNRELLLADGKAAKAVLANKDGLFAEHSDFFTSAHGVLGPRKLQQAISSQAKQFLTLYLKENKPNLKEKVKQAFTPVSHWPDTGNWLIYHHFEHALLHKETPQQLRKWVSAVVKRAVLSGARDNYNALQRLLFRFRITRAITREIKQRRQQSIDKPRDLLDVIIKETPEQLPVKQLIEVFFSFIFSTAGSIGFVLGWSVYMLGRDNNGEIYADAKPGWVVLEALRLWPVAWNLGRYPAKKQLLAGKEITPEDTVVVCPYAVHRNPDNWHQAERFNPLRWQRNRDMSDIAELDKDKPFIPFGWGEHICPAANLSIQVVENILSLLAPYRLKAENLETSPLPAAALAPPAFVLQIKEKSTS